MIQNFEQLFGKPELLLDIFDEHAYRVIFERRAYYIWIGGAGRRLAIDCSNLSCKAPRFSARVWKNPNTVTKLY